MFVVVRVFCNLVWHEWYQRSATTFTFVSVAIFSDFGFNGSQSVFFTLVLEDKWNRFLSTFPDTHLTVPKQSKYWRNLKTLTQTNGVVWSFRLSPMCFWGQGCYTGCLIPMTGLLFFLFKHQRQWSQVTYMPVRLSAITKLQPFSGLFSRTTWVSQYQKGKTNH